MYRDESNELANYWFQKAANTGDVSSMWELSGAYESGDGVEQDWERSLYWQIKAAEAGHEGAQHGLEMQHNHGDLDIGDEQVFNWYIWSAEHRHVWAQLFLADAYLVGDKLEQDDKQSIYWYRKAAEQGDKLGQAHPDRQPDSKQPSSQHKSASQKVLEAHFKGKRPTKL